VGQSHDKRSVPFLVDRLTDSEAEVRMYAILALERVTGRTFGYKYYERPELRELAVQRWRTWLGQRAPAVEGKTPVAGGAAPSATTTPHPPSGASTAAGHGKGGAR